MRCAFAVQQSVTDQDAAVSTNSRNEFLSASTRVTVSSRTMTSSAMVSMSRLASRDWPNRAPLIVAVGLIFEVGCAKERGPLVISPFCD